MSQDLEQALRELLDKQAITEVLFRYCRGVDRGDGELLRSVYHPDAEDYHGIYNGPVSGLFQQRGSTRATYLATSHKVSNVLIELAGETAHVESYLDAIHRAQTPEGLRDDFLRCRYVDRFEKRAGEWKIARRVVIYDWGTTVPAVEHAWWDTEPGEYEFGKRGRDDRVYADRAENLGPI